MTYPEELSNLSDVIERVERALREYPLSWHVEIDAYDVQVLVDAAKRAAVDPVVSDGEGDVGNSMFRRR